MAPRREQRLEHDGIDRLFEQTELHGKRVLPCLMRVLSAEDTASLVVEADGVFAFSTRVLGAYAVSVQTQPMGQTSTVTNASGPATAQSAPAFANNPRNRSSNAACAASPRPTVCGSALHIHVS